VIAIILSYNWTQTHYYVGNDHGYVAIYRGVQQSIGPIPLSSVYEKTTIAVSQLKPFNRSQVNATLSAGNLTLAKDIVDRLANAGN
jgi:protein phosphatase